MNSFQNWADIYARTFGFTVTPVGNWVTLHKDGASVECMSAKGVQLCCYGPAGRLKVWTLTTDQDGEGTATAAYSDEAAARGAYARIVAAAWESWFGPDAGPMPEDAQAAYDVLCDQIGYLDHIALRSHDLPLPSVFG